MTDEAPVARLIAFAIGTFRLKRTSESFDRLVLLQAALRSGR